MFTQFFAVELCVLSGKPAFGLLTWISLYEALFFLLTLRMQITMVARETTLINVSASPISL